MNPNDRPMEVYLSPPPPSQRRRRRRRRQMNTTGTLMIITAVKMMMMMLMMVAVVVVLTNTTPIFGFLPLVRPTRIMTPSSSSSHNPLSTRHLRNDNANSAAAAIDINNNNNNNNNIPLLPKEPTASTTTETSSSTSTTTATTKPPPTPSPPLSKKKLQTYLRYLEVECWKRPDYRGLEPILQGVANACQRITRLVQRAQTDDIYGVADLNNNNNNNPDNTNIQGEVQQKLDVLCNTILLQAFCGSGREIYAVASEEEAVPQCCAAVMNDAAFAMGDFVAVFDPLDGSKNIDASLPVGTIFGIYQRPPGETSNQDNKNDDHDASSFLQNGHHLVSAGYCLYSATTVLVLTLGSGVDGFTLDPDTGRFLHTHKDIRIPAAGPIYSFNEAHFNDYDEPVRRYLEALKSGSSSVGVRSNARYVGALVADVHNVLINGGIYGYPRTKSHTNGKLRLLYESAPMAMIIEQAGGAGSTGHGRILDVTPTQIHERVPTFLGSKENVFELDQFYRYYGDDVVE